MIIELKYVGFWTPEVMYFGIKVLIDICPCELGTPSF
jgi:hypothetical protein